jgi:hypothetical protein
MSSIGGVGGIGGLGALGTNISVGGIGAPATGGLNGPLGNVNAATVSTLSGTRLDQLMQLLDGFSSAEILIALMLSAASGHHKNHDGVDDAALGFLIGLSLASQIGQNGMPGMSSSAGVPGPNPVDGSTGGQINLTA